jgi:aconitate hydratase
MFTTKYASVFEGSDMWKNTHVPSGELFAWDEASTYIHHPPYFQQLSLNLPPIEAIKGARVLAIFRDSITTDHISPVGSIAPASPAGKFLQERGVSIKDFNTYGTRRGNDLVMVRGTFGNIRLKNVMVEPKEGFFTRHQLSGDVMTIYEAAMSYQSEGVPTVVLAGKEYGNGSSRDWAAKGPLLLGVKAVIAESFERIHRSNLVGMGVLPLRFVDGQNVQSLGLDGTEAFDFDGLDADLSPRSEITVKATRPDGYVISFPVTVLLNTPVEVNYYRNGGLLHTMLRKMVSR